jgi:UDP-N-acetylglucosamine--N-acetylmuramyl-(pentapeptide) pyrophosphoryl-undecaprenol N-acetylglucosamine transferase
MPKYRFIMAGAGGTGGHIFPALAVARVLRDRGHDVLFIGNREGMEARLVPEAGFQMDFIRVGALNRAGLRRQLQTAVELPVSAGVATGILGSWKPDAVFSMGGFVAGPVVLGAVLRRIPIVAMEPNAIPGFTNRKLAPFVYRALAGFEETARWFPAGRTEVTGVPIRPEFFSVPPKTEGKFTLFITGGSLGAHTLNEASRASWPLFRDRQAPVRIVHQTGRKEYDALAKEFEHAGIDGEVVPFLNDMPGAFAEADLVLGRAGAGGVSEIAAANMPSILVPLPFAADDHQKKNAEALANAGAARLILNKDLTGERLFQEVEQLRQAPEVLKQMREKVRGFARRGAAERAAGVLEEAAQEKTSRKRR